MVDVRFSYQGVRVRQSHHITKSIMARTYLNSTITRDEISLTVKLLTSCGPRVLCSVDVASHTDMSNYLSPSTVTSKDPISYQRKSKWKRCPKQRSSKTL
jgi:hypothetical protein